jgi:hypothetical protein
MSLTERLSQAPKGRGHSCTVGILLATMPLEHNTAERDALIGAMQRREWNSTALVEAMASEGYTVDRRHMQQHRRGDCTSANCPMPNDGLQQ